MKIDKYDVVLIDGDISILSDKFHYATLNYGRMVGSQCNYKEGTKEHGDLLKKLDNIYELFIEVNKIINE